MRAYDVIKAKRDGLELSAQDIRDFICAYVKGDIPDYQAAALCMAIYFRGMSVAETTALTEAIRDSGERLDLSSLSGFRVDKHSTGGVGDKTSLVVAPLVAACGVKVAKMSGRGLGHTGGTVDKLEAIEGFCTSPDKREFERIVRETGLCIVGQSADLAPADKLLYALRDVTATVDSLPLIASSIMGKKLAADDDGIVLDVKTGSGAFMKSVEDSRALASLMVQIGQRAGKRTVALLTDMDRPLGLAVGNALEVAEAIEALRGNGPQDLVELCLALATEMLLLAGHGDREVCYDKARDALESGAALGAFARMVQAQGGDVSVCEHPERLCRAPFTRAVCSPRDGYIARVDCEAYGKAALLLGAGRNKKEDAVDLSAGYLLKAKTGDFVRTGDPIAVMYASNEALFDSAAHVLLCATEFSDTPPAPRPLILERVDG